MTSISSLRAKQQAAACVLYTVLDNDLTALLWSINAYSAALEGQITVDKGDLPAVLMEYADHFGVEVVQTESEDGHEPAFTLWTVAAKVDEVPVRVWGMLDRPAAEAPAATEPAAVSA